MPDPYHLGANMALRQAAYVNAPRKLKVPLSGAKALEVVEQYLTWTVVENTSKLLAAAISLRQETRLSFWDAMVAQAALEADCETLYSEGLNAGQRFGALAFPAKSQQGG